MDGGLLAGGAAIVLTIVIGIVSIVATVVPIVIVFRRISELNGNRRQLLMHGTPAQARIVQMGPTGLIVNHAPQLNLVLEVQPPPAPGFQAAAAPFVANVQALVPIYAMARIQPGATVPVRFNPANPTQLAIDFPSMGYS